VISVPSLAARPAALGPLLAHVIGPAHDELRRSLELLRVGQGHQRPQRAFRGQRLLAQEGHDGRMQAAITFPE
jgi:hypothetical protein